MTKTPYEKTNTRNVAVALKYEHAEHAVPQVVAIGRGHMAQKILDTAEAAEVPIERNEPLAQSLAGLKLDEAIPPELYKAVAAVISFLIKKRYLR